MKTHSLRMVNSYLLLVKVDNKNTHDFEPALKRAGAKQSLGIFGSVRKCFEIIGNCRKIRNSLNSLIYNNSNNLDFLEPFLFLSGKKKLLLE